MTHQETGRIVSRDLLAGRTALLVASTSGIGAESARQLADAGIARVVVNGRNAETGERVVAGMRAHAPGTRFDFVQGDVTDPRQAQAVFEKAAALLDGRLDVYVHNAGAQIKPDLFVNADPATFQPMMDGHFNCMMYCCHHAVKLMRAGGGGAIVTVASDAGKIATPGEAIIGAAKAAAIMFTRGLALEVSRFGIRANCVSPSIVRDTISYQRVMSGELSRKVFEKAESRARLGVPTPRDIAPLVVFLASPLSARITGQAISVNGGISAA